MITYRFQHIDDTEDAREEFQAQHHVYGGDVITLTREDLNALVEGKLLAFQDGEYANFIRWVDHE